MEKVAEFSLFFKKRFVFFFFFTLFKKQFNASELGVVWEVSRENVKGMETRKFISTVKLLAL